MCTKFNQVDFTILDSAAGALVREGQEISPETLAMGVPTEVKREITEADLQRILQGKDDYVRLGQLIREADEK